MQTIFRENGYYYNHVEKLTEDIENKVYDGTLDLKEMLLRDLISRAYFTAFLFCRDKIEDYCHKTFPRTRDSHDMVSSCIVNTKNSPLLKEYFTCLKQMRNEADYETSQNVLDGIKTQSKQIGITLSAKAAYYRMRYIVKNFNESNISCANLP